MIQDSLNVPTNNGRYHPSFRDAPLGAGPESIRPVVVMDSGLARKLLAPRNDGEIYVAMLG